MMSQKDAKQWEIQLKSFENCKKSAQFENLFKFIGPKPCQNSQFQLNVMIFVNLFQMEKIGDPLR